MKHYITYLILFFCFYSYSQNTAQDKAEFAVRNHIKETFPDKEYHGYEFGDLYKITPVEITDLEEIKKEAASIDIANDSLISFYDSLIKEKTNEIQEKQLFSTFEINHFFTLKEKFKENILFEYNFVLYPDGNIKDVEKILEHELTNDEYDYYYYFYKRKDLYNAKEENPKIYDYLINLYESESQSKEAAMITLLTVCKVVYEHDVYDTILISRIEAQKWLVKNFDNPVIKEYSQVSPIIDSSTNEVIGYNIFAKIIHNDTVRAFYFEFDYDYILRGILPVTPPFEKYFETKKTGTIKEE